MAKVSILVIEDDVEQLSEITLSLDKAGYHVSGTASTLQEALGLFYSVQPDIVVADIYLGSQPDGIKFAQRIAENSNTSRPVIFLTQHTDMETFQQAKLTGPYNYLLKPYNPLELQFSIELAMEKFVDMPGVFSSGADTGAMKGQTLYVKKGNSIYKINSGDIHVVAVEGKYCQITSDQGKFLVQQPLKKMEEHLVALGFLRIHRNYLINSNSIKQINTMDSQVMLNDQSVVPFSQSYREKLMSKIDILK